MNKAAKFIIDRTTDPVIVFYENNKNNKKYNEEERELLKKLKGNAISARIVLSRLKEVGDVYNYLKTIVSGPNDDRAINFRKFNFTPFEDIVNDFKNTFYDELDVMTTVDSLELEGLYSTWDVVFLTNNFTTRTFGILTIKNEIDEIEGIVIRGKFDLVENNYANKWISEDEVLYHLIGENYKKTNINNTNLLTGKYPIYLFETIGTNQQVFRGEFRLAEYLQDTHQVRLVKENYCNRKSRNIN